MSNCLLSATSYLVAKVSISVVIKIGRLQQIIQTQMPELLKKQLEAGRVLRFLLKHRFVPYQPQQGAPTRGVFTGGYLCRQVPAWGLIAGTVFSD